MRSPLAVCLLIRYMSKILHDDISATNARAAYQVCPRFQLLGLNNLSESRRNTKHVFMVILD